MNNLSLLIIDFLLGVVVGLALAFWKPQWIIRGALNLHGVPKRTRTYH